jgi:hypothetical protein
MAAIHFFGQRGQCMRIPVPGPCSAAVISAGFPGFARVLQILVSPTPIYRDLQGHFGGAALPTPDAQTTWHARNTVCELAGNVLRGAQGGRRQFRSIRHLRCPASLRSPTTSRCRPAGPSKEKSPASIIVPPSRVVTLQQPIGRNFPANAAGLCVLVAEHAQRGELDAEACHVDEVGVIKLRRRSFAGS